MKDLPHPEVAPAEAQDWRPLLDRELSRLPEKYRAAVVLFDLEGRTRKEAAQLLHLPEGTLSSRLATARQMLARRLAGCGLALSGGALATALAQGSASGGVPAALVSVTTRAALLVAAGQVAALSGPAAVLMKGVMKAMLLKKLRLVVGAALVLAALGAVGLASRAGDAAGAAAPPDKAANELEALRKENELLKLNLQIVLEKYRVQEAELQTARKELASAQEAGKGVVYNLSTTYMRPLATTYDFGFPISQVQLNVPNTGFFYNLNRNMVIDQVPYLLQQAGNAGTDPVAEAAQEAEGAIKALREAKDKEGQRRAAEALDKAMAKLKEQLKK